MNKKQGSESRAEDEKEKRLFSEEGQRKGAMLVQLARIKGLVHLIFNSILFFLFF